MRRTVVTGADGQVGRALRAIWPAATLLDRATLDVTDRDRAMSAIEGADLVVHLAAMTRVDGCEANPDEATRVNVEGTRNVADAAQRAGASLIFLSTDYVFDGSSPAPYRETDAPSPLNVYGRTKLEGERIVGATPRGLVLRVSWVYGEGSNFVRTIIEAGERTKHLTVVDDQVGRPTAANDIARAIDHSAKEGTTGIVHYTGGGEPCSWAQLAERALRLVGSDASVEPIDTETYVARSERVVAPRPKNSVLSLDRAEQQGYEVRDWTEALSRYLAH